MRGGVLVTGIGVVASLVNWPWPFLREERRLAEESVSFAVTGATFCRLTAEADAPIRDEDLRFIIGKYIN